MHPLHMAQAFALRELTDAASDSDSETELLKTLVTGRRLRDISDLPFDLSKCRLFTSDQGTDSQGAILLTTDFKEYSGAVAGGVP